MLRRFLAAIAIAFAAGLLLAQPIHWRQYTSSTGKLVWDETSALGVEMQLDRDGNLILKGVIQEVEGRLILVADTATALDNSELDGFGGSAYIIMQRKDNTDDSTLVLANDTGYQWEFGALTQAGPTDPPQFGIKKVTGTPGSHVFTEVFVIEHDTGYTWIPSPFQLGVGTQPVELVHIAGDGAGGREVVKLESTAPSGDASIALQFANHAGSWVLGNDFALTGQDTVFLQGSSGTVWIASDEDSLTIGGSELRTGSTLHVRDGSNSRTLVTARAATAQTLPIISVEDPAAVETFSVTPAGAVVTASDLTVGATALHVDAANQRVGIGFSSPAESLHSRVATGTNHIKVESLGANAIAGIVMQNDAQTWRSGVFGTLGDAWTVNDVNAGLTPIVCEVTAPSNSMRIKSDGKVGLGTSAPATRLDVAGDINTRGHLRSSNSAPTVSACGTSPAISGTDVAGKVTVGTGSVTTCTLTFATAYAGAPSCVFTSSAGGAPDATTTTTAAVFTRGSSMAGQVVMYICIGRS